MDDEIAQHILEALDYVPVSGLRAQETNLRAAQIVQKIRNGEAQVTDAMIEADDE